MKGVLLKMKRKSVSRSRSHKETTHFDGAEPQRNADPVPLSTAPVMIKIIKNDTNLNRIRYRNRRKTI
jgi:hypothetical protein